MQTCSFMWEIDINICAKMCLLIVENCACEFIYKAAPWIFDVIFTKKC